MIDRLIASLDSETRLWLLIGGGLLLIVALAAKKRAAKYVAVPAPGASIPIIGQWLEAYRFVHDSAGVIEDGMRKAYNGERATSGQCAPTGQTFKISTPTRWIVIATDPAVLRELKYADESVLSMQAAADERNSISYVLDNTIHSNPYHMDIILKNLTLRLGVLIPEIMEETSLCLEEYFSSKAIGYDEWIPLDEAFLSRCVSAITGRVLVGLPMCRDREYSNILVNLTKRISRAGYLCNIAPEFMKGLIASRVVKQSAEMRKFLEKLGPVFEERKAMIAKYGDEWEGQPNDCVQWVLKSAPPNTPIHELCFRIFYLDFSAIHTTTLSVTQGLYDLSAHPDSILPIRQEIEAVLGENNGEWTKHSLSMMRKLDSSLKESQRLHPVTTAVSMRKALRPYKLVDGTLLPKGVWAVVPAYSLNRSREYYDDPETFDAFRFSRKEDDGAKHGGEGMAHPDENGYVSFGIGGRNACPGRFFAAAQIKLLIGFILMNFDLKMSFPHAPKPGEPITKDKFAYFLCLPGGAGEVVLMKRRKGVAERARGVKTGY